MMTTYRIILIAFIYSLVSACSLTSKSDSPAVVIDRTTSSSDSGNYRQDDIVQRAPVVSSGAVGRLTEVAQNHAQRGEWSQAANSLERALRISPRNARLWLQLSEIRFKQRRYQQAESLAQKALQYAVANQALKRDCWLQVAKSRQQLGNARGAEAARQQAGQFE